MASILPKLPILSKKRVFCFKNAFFSILNIHLWQGFRIYFDVFIKGKINFSTFCKFMQCKLLKMVLNASKWQKNAIFLAKIHFSILLKNVCFGEKCPTVTWNQVCIDFHSIIKNYILKMSGVYIFNMVINSFKMA